MPASVTTSASIEVPAAEAPSSDRVAVGYVVRAKGLRGEVRVEPLTHSIERFEELDEVVLEREGCPDLKLQIESWRFDQPGILLKFAGIDEPETAREKLAKGYLTIPRGQVAPLPEDTYYVFELIGCAVEDESGETVGEIIDVVEMPSADMYVVRHRDGDVMIPAVRKFVRHISIAEKRVVVSEIESLVNVK